MNKIPIIIYQSDRFYNPFIIKDFQELHRNNVIVTKNNEGKSNEVCETIATWIISTNSDIPLIVWYNINIDKLLLLDKLKKYYNDESIKLGYNITDYTNVGDSKNFSNIMCW